MAKIRVLVVDDSALMREMISDILRQDAEIEVIGAARDPYAARDKILSDEPDVVTLDVEMPRMDGLTFLEKLMSGHPLPVVMLSSLTEKGCETTLRALELGAVDFVTKPKLDLSQTIGEQADEIIAKVKAAATARVKRLDLHAKPARKNSRPCEALITSTHKVIAIGASTGGTEALASVLSALPSNSPGIVAVIHMPPNFTKAYAERLDNLCDINVKEAAHGDRILPGHALIAPGNYHMSVFRSGANYSVKINQDERVNRHRPSVNVLFDSCAQYLGTNVTGVMLTGMGDDGASGMLAMHEAGAKTIAQDEATCVVFGMPKAAIAVGAVDTVLPLSKIPDAMLRYCRDTVAAH
ncbi:MAG: chemotaxis response regulator protein-glutamate methylesterase [Planctomycetales bacterium]|nr:chemotaxis response regulator protein-glutamate methylesterase [Planctomycetales bacterium]